MQLRLDQLDQAVDLKMNLAKTKWMRNPQAANNNNNNNNIHIGQKEIEQVDSYVYLGQELTAEHKNNRELARRLRAAWVSYASIAEVVTNTADAPLRANLFNRPCSTGPSPGR